MTKTAEPIGSLVYEQIELKKKAKDPHNTEITESFKASGECLSNISQDAGILVIYASRACHRD